TGDHRVDGRVREPDRRRLRPGGRPAPAQLRRLRPAPYPRPAERRRGAGTRRRGARAASPGSGRGAGGVRPRAGRARRDRPVPARVRGERRAHRAQPRRHRCRQRDPGGRPGRGDPAGQPGHVPDAAASVGRADARGDRRHRDHPRPVPVGDHDHHRGRQTRRGPAPRCRGRLPDGLAGHRAGRLPGSAPPGRPGRRRTPPGRPLSPRTRKPEPRKPEPLEGGADIMARIKIAYLGGGSSRAAGTMASLLWHGAEFAGSEVVLIDLDPDRLDVVRRITEQLIKAQGVDLTVTATTDRRAGLRDVDVVLSSFRPGGFEARALDERIPLKHGVIGQETQGPGGFFMALRSIAVLQEVVEELNQVAPRAKIFNYTNPVNLGAPAVTENSDVELVSLCEGPITFPETVLRAAGLDPARAEVIMAGLNHNCWSTEHRYDGADLIPLLEQAWAERRDDPTLGPHSRRALRRAATMGSVPADYVGYYYFREA